VIVTTADAHVIGPRRREAEAPPPGAVEDSSLDGTAQGGARAMLRGDTSPGAALSAARRATLSGDTSPAAHMRRAASIPFGASLGSSTANDHATRTLNFREGENARQLEID